MPPSLQIRTDVQWRATAPDGSLCLQQGAGVSEERYARGDKKFGYAWHAPVHPLWQTLKDLGRAYANFFVKQGVFPSSKKRGQRDSFCYPDAKQIKLDEGNSRIFLLKLGWLRYRNSRDALGVVKKVTVSQCGVKWYVSIQTEREVRN